MPFIETVREEDAESGVARMYAEAQASFGYVPNLAKVFSPRPEVMKAWEGLCGAIKGNMDLRRYEIATLGAARQLSSSYCMLAHGGVLMREGVAPETVRAIAKGEDDDAITPEERAVIAFASKIAADATSVRQDDIDGLRGHGLSDAEIFDVAATAAARCFFSKLLDALGTEPDAIYTSLDKDLRDALTVGRAIAQPDAGYTTP